MTSGRRSGKSFEAIRYGGGGCGFTEEYTLEYIAVVRGEHLGRWVCGLCAEAVGGETITTVEVLDRHSAFACAAPRAPGRATEDLVAAVTRLLRRCLNSPPAAPPQGQKVAASPRCPDAEDA